MTMGNSESWENIHDKESFCVCAVNAEFAKDF